MIRKSIPNEGPAHNPEMRCERALDPETYLPQTNDENFYGRFITLGYHSTSGPLSNPLEHHSERNKIFELWKRAEPNGLRIMVDATGKPVVSGRLDRSLLQTSNTIRVTVPGRFDQVVEWTLKRSPDHDLFQFGRDESNNDFYLPGHSTQHIGYRYTVYNLFSPRPTQLVSRMAFRVECCRKTNEARIAAAGFDYENKLFLGPAALTWETKIDRATSGFDEVEGVDGGITAGLHVWKPNPTPNGGSITGNWYEISALGEMYHLRTNGKRGQKAGGVDNRLTSGCIVVNADSVLLFTSISPSRDKDFLTPAALASRLEQMKSILCPITLEQIDLNNAMISNALRPPRSTVSVRASPSTEEAIYSNAARAGVFPKCGHVFELPRPHINARLVACPKCRVPGLMVPLVLQTAHTFMTRTMSILMFCPVGMQ